MSSVASKVVCGLTLLENSNASHSFHRPDASAWYNRGISMEPKAGMDMKALCDGIVSLIANRGQDDSERTGCVIKALFAPYIEDSTPKEKKPPLSFSWRGLWEKCWNADYEAHKKVSNADASFGQKVRGSVAMARRKIDLYYATVGRSAKERVEIRRSPYQLSFRKNEALVVPRTPLKDGRVIGILCSSSEWFRSDLIEGIEYAARQASMRVIVTFNTDDNLELEAQQLASLSEQCSGLIVLPILDEFARGAQELTAPFQNLFNTEYPFVFVERAVPDCPVPLVGSDNEEGGRMAADYLARECRCENLFVLAEAGSSTAQSRTDGFVQYVNQNRGADSNPPIEYADGGELAGYEFAERLLSPLLEEEHGFGKLPIGIFATDDDLSQGAHTWVERHAPEEIRHRIFIIGFGGRRAQSIFSPQLPTLRQDHHSIGQTAVSTLVKLLKLKESGKLHGDLQAYSARLPVTYMLPAAPGSQATVLNATLSVDEDDFESQVGRTIG